MTTATKAKLTITQAPKGSKGSKAAPASKFKAGAPAPLGFNLYVDETGLGYTVLGTDAMGSTVDISAVATMTVTSDTPAVCTVTAPVGMTFSVAAGVPNPAVGATATLTITVTWTDGSVGPFTGTVLETVVADPVTGITVQPTAA